MKRDLRKRRRAVGFTLMEVLLVLAILVILGSFVGYYMLGAQEKAFTRAAQSQISTFDQMLLGYRLDVGSYPSTSQGLQSLREAPADMANSKWDGPYAEKTIPPDPWGNPYQYELVDADNFHIWSWGPNGQSGDDDDINNTT
ncbi:MAG: type II secretion system major pseudopilin GspG [Pirellulaceae bacterium]|jgi:general secretion pathway protein G|nr:type II secretion system major pseudopilin GspG [Pirellulaceae bacterium]MDP6557904.1 type II secretion system major pseudopilin GspG [Pirellulaceae bacterium]